MLADGLLQVAGGLLRAHRQILIARGDLAAGGVDAIGGAAHFTHDAGQSALHLAQRLHQGGELIAPMDRQWFA